MSVRVLTVLLSTLAYACVHADSVHNAPGNVDVRTRPTEARDREPGDPGENMLTVAAGGFGGGGARFPTGGDSKGFSAFGAEISAFGSTSRTRHVTDFFVTPETAFGMNLGATLLGSNPRGGRPLYAELAGRFNYALGVGVGWNADVGDGTHGPQVTLNAGPLYVRVAHQFGNATFLSVGLVLKGQMVFAMLR
jgi:hypothetical protein